MYVRNDNWKDEVKEENTTRFFEQVQLQKMQNAFCESNHVYCVCVERNGEAVTAFSGDAEEEAYINTLFSREKQQDLLAGLSDVDGENIVAVSPECPYIMVRGVAIRGALGRLAGAWLVFGVDEEKIPEDVFVSSAIHRTTEKGFDASIALLDILTSNYFANKNRMLSLAEDISTIEKEEKRMEYLLQKTEVLTEILKMMESDQSFSEVVESILAEAGKYMMLSECCLLKIDTDDTTVLTVAEWAGEESHALKDKMDGLSKEELPFATGRPYTISSDTSMPAPFIEFFAKFGIRAGVFLPISISGKDDMYLCFSMVGQDYKWSVEDLKFLNDIKRVVQTILIKRVTKNSLASSYSALESILENAGCGVSVIDMRHNQVLYNNGAYENLGLIESDMMELEKLLMVSPENMGGIHEYQAVSSGRWFEVSFAQMHWVDGREVRLATVYDITKTKQYQEKVEHQANVDYLTGLYNRMRFEEDLTKEIHSAVRTGGQSAALYIDLDDFDNINDGLGHQAGDSLLQNVAKALQRIDGIGESCYRIGGDEFVVLVRSRQIEQLEVIVKKIQRAFAKPWVFEGAEYYCTMSMGVVMIPKDGVETDLLMQRADIALHSAKSLGKNRVEYYNGNQLSGAAERLDLEKCMREAVEQGCKEFEIYYQPLIDVTRPDKPCCGAEALVRWNSPTLGFVMPSQFIPLAEYLGLINEIGRHVLYEACKRCKYWNDFGHPEYKVNVNLSVVQLLQNDIIETIHDALEATGVNPASLTLEVTEGLAINDIKRMQYVLHEIKKLGVRVALDDFGTGYSSLSHIRNMPIDVIKIDRCFVEDIGADVFSDAFVKSVAQLADALHMNICVEGVEEQQQCDALGRMNVDMIQGFLFDKPLSVDDFESKYLF